MLRRTLPALACLLAISACHPTVVGNGVLARRTDSVASFRGVSALDKLRVNVTVVSDARQTGTVTIEGDENVLAHVDYTTVENDVLTVKFKGVAVETQHPIIVTVNTLDLRTVHAESDGHVRAYDLPPDADFEATAASLGRVELLAPAGVTGTATLHATLTSATLAADAFPVGTAVVALSTSSEAAVSASDTVTGSVDATSSIEVHGGAGCQGFPADQQPRCTSK